MANTGEQLEATAQLDRARVALGEALGQTQDITEGGLDVEKVSQSLAMSVRDIYAVQSAGVTAPSSGSHIESAMNHLRQTLILLQDVRSDDPALDLATRTVARTLALLYPVSKVLELMKAVPGPESRPSKISQIPRPADEGDERRTSDRRTVEVDIGFQSDSNFFTGFSQGYLFGGLFVATYDILYIGTQLNVNFSLPFGGPVLSLDGTVRWVREYNETTPDMQPGMGIQFDDLTQDDVSVINDFIAEHPPIFFEEA